jgi:ubiquinone/menaquinone biosynthesis C-methylase UbiE
MKELLFYTKKEYEIVKRYDSFNILGTALFMNDGYCYLDKDNMPVQTPLKLNKKWKPWTYQINLYNVLLETSEIDLKNKNISLLDIACGQGGGVSFYRDYYKFKEIYGLDLNPNHISHASNRDSNVSFINASATEIPLENSKFDVVTCLEAESYFEPFEKYCKEVSRVLKKKGVLIHASPVLFVNKKNLEKYFKITKIKNIHLNVGIGCAISKHLFKKNEMLKTIYTNDENANLIGNELYEIYVMKNK